MPILEFQCNDCKKSFDFFKIRSDEQEPNTCKYCGSVNIVKLFPKSRFKLKGACWSFDGYDYDCASDLKE